MSDSYTDQMTRHSSEIKRNIGYTLHPSVAATLPATPRIADIGTGTGRFLLILHTLYPDATLDGSDISSALYPPQDGLPSNVTLTVLNAKEHPPEHLHGQYHMVHPGGYLQWEECDFAGCKYIREKVDSTVEAARFIGYAFRDALMERFEHGWSTLPQIMRDAGLTSVLSDIVSSDRLPETREKLTTTGMQAIFSWARLMTERGAKGALYDIYVFCGQKPAS
ncbi:S-adenosyl-L-methionine-dependent methyltransferase [Xylaria venustula]|nr:S-adenosyl-L-methionine-dependent methyltransferase [Xylaria venustula]